MERGCGQRSTSVRQLRRRLLVERLSASRRLRGEAARRRRRGRLQLQQLLRVAWAGRVALVSRRYGRRAGQRQHRRERRLAHRLGRRPDGGLDVPVERVRAVGLPAAGRRRLPHAAHSEAGGARLAGRTQPAARRRAPEHQRDARALVLARRGRTADPRLGHVASASSAPVRLCLFSAATATMFSVRVLRESSVHSVTLVVASTGPQ